jgi:hypothetical protein
MTPNKLKYHSAFNTVNRFIIAIIILLLTACGDKPQSSGANMDNQPVIVKFGQQSFQYARDEHQPAGITFRERKWRYPNLGTVRFEHGRYSFDMGSVFYLLSSVDGRYESDGMQDFTAHFGVSDPDSIRHREAYQLITAYTKHLLDLGWQRYIPYNHPRLAGRDAYRYAKEKRYWFDPKIALTYEQWLGLIGKETYYIDLYADGVILSMIVRQTILNQEHMNERRPDLDVKEWGGYLYRIEVRSVKDYVRVETQAYSDAERAKNWLINWESKKQELFSWRKEEEDKLRKEGYRIDESYKDIDFTPYLK